MSLTGNRHPRLIDISDRYDKGGSSNTRVPLNEAGTILSIGGRDVVVPPHCLLLEVQPRLCGDYYAEIRGKGFYVSGCGVAAVDAVESAIAKVPVSA